MALIYPGASWRPLGGKSTTPVDARIVNIHTMVGTLAGTESWFSGSGRAYSHFGVGGRGEIWQWQDLRYKAASDLEGNPYSISIECEDSRGVFPAWSGSDVPSFASAQLDALVRLVVWLCDRFGIPKSLVPDSLPGRRGISYHRLGIDPWRVPDGLRYSGAYGKGCPGDRRVAQIRDVIVPRVRGASPTPKEDGFLMALSDAQQKALYKAIVGDGRLKEVTLAARRIDKRVEEIHRVRQEFVRAIPTGWKGGDPVYVTDLHSFAHPIDHTGPLDGLIKSLLAIAGFDADAVEISKAALAELVAKTG